MTLRSFWKTLLSCKRHIFTIVSPPLFFFTKSSEKSRSEPYHQIRENSKFWQCWAFSGKHFNGGWNQWGAQGHPRSMTNLLVQWFRQLCAEGSAVLISPFLQSVCSFLFLLLLFFVPAVTISILHNWNSLLSDFPIVAVPKELGVRGINFNSHLTPPKNIQCKSYVLVM